MADLYDGTKVRVGLAYASGTADRNGAIMDMAGYDEIEAVVTMATIAADGGPTVKLQYGDESDLSDAADVAGASHSVADDDDDQIFRLTLVRPTKRYVRVVIDKDAANASAESTLYRMSKARNLPVTANTADEVTATRVASV